MIIIDKTNTNTNLLFKEINKLLKKTSKKHQNLKR